MNAWTFLALVGCLIHAASLLVLAVRVGAARQRAERANRFALEAELAPQTLVYGDPAEGEWERTG